MLKKLMYNCYKKGLNYGTSDMQRAHTFMHNIMSLKGESDLHYRNMYKMPLPGQLTTKEHRDELGNT